MIHLFNRLLPDPREKLQRNATNQENSSNQLLQINLLVFFSLILLSHSENQLLLLKTTQTRLHLTIAQLLLNYYSTVTQLLFNYYLIVTQLFNYYSTIIQTEKLAISLQKFTPLQGLRHPVTNLHERFTQHFSIIQSCTE